MAALGPGKGNFAANCGEPGASGRRADPSSAAAGAATVEGGWAAIAGASPPTEETGKAIAWVNFVDPGHYKWSGEIDGGDGPGRRAPEKMVGAAGFEPATPTPPV